jgi:hypothetical protein
MRLGPPGRYRPASNAHAARRRRADQEDAMPIVQRSAVIPLDLEAAWDAFFGDEMQRWVRLSDLVVEVRDYRIRPDGMPEYVMVNAMGPMRASHRSVYVRFEPPRHAEDDTLESDLGGRWITDHEPVEGGTRVTHTWHVEPKGVMRLLFPLIRARFERTFQEDLDRMVERIERAQAASPSATASTPA